MHYWDPTYKYPARSESATRATLIAALLDGMPLQPEADLSGSFTVKGYQRAMHEGIDYSNRHPDDIWDPAAVTLEPDTSDIGAMVRESGQPAIDPLVEKIRRKIAGLRPSTVKPGDKDFESERWLKLPTDK